MSTPLHRFVPFVCALLAASALPARADEAPSFEDWSLHGQATFTDQYHPSFTSPFQGANSLGPRASAKETFDATLFAGARLWRGAEIYVNPEIDQGFGLSNTLGLAGFSSGEAYKVGKSHPYFRLQRAFVRQSFDLGGSEQTIDADANQLAGTRTQNNLVLTVGKFAVTDVFDANGYAHDPRGDFLNWAIIDAGAFDYAADAWGYSYGAASELNLGHWSLRAGLFNLSKVPNSEKLESDFHQHESVLEIEHRHTLAGQPGKVRVLWFDNHGKMGSYADALALATTTGSPPDTSLVRRWASRTGVALNVEQQIDDSLGVFIRASANDGSKEAFEFTEINRSLAAGVALKGSRWGRAKDTLGAAVEVSGISAAARAYLAAGGMGILIGDGQLPRYGCERIGEAYYDASLSDHLGLTMDLQHVDNPAYDAARGPVWAMAVRVHAAF
ncbi:MAG: carbohydrate porin [Proteobacteria bacterium]|nr:carbohydrate porin [Pseudomonadota bacterium]